MTAAADLSDLSRLTDWTTRCFTPENPDASAGGGARATTGTGTEQGAELSEPWKVSPSVLIPAGAEHVLAEPDGPGIVRHLWLATRPENWRTLLLRAYWDGDSCPAVEVPVADFFGQGWGSYAELNSLPVITAPYGGMNAYWTMPFADGARITVQNLGRSESVLYYAATVDAGPIPDSSARFHAQWRRSNPNEEMTPHVLLEGIEGRGQYAGSYVAWGSNSTGWWGEGEVKFYLDDDRDHPTVCSTGLEDYLGGAWSFHVPGVGYQPFSSAYLGLHQVLKPDGVFNSQQRFGMYRWHVSDPIRFSSRLRVDVQPLGYHDLRFIGLRDDIATMSVFYLDRSSTTRPPTPGRAELEVH